jgi:hypothetical protein
MRAVFILLAICLSFAARATNGVEIAAAIKTNLVIKSDTVESLGWTRQAVMVTPSNRVMDPSGKLVEAAEASVQSNEAERISAVADAAVAGMRDAFDALYAVTGMVSDIAYHVAVTLPPGDAPASLQGFVVKEETDGLVDTQWVWYSQGLAAPPVRRVEYTTPSGVFSQPVTWIGWKNDGETVAANGRTWNGCHRCEVVRPVAARNLPALTRKNEIFGGSGGFDFGAALVTVGGKAAFTGSVTNELTGEVLKFDNGVLKKGEAKDAE